MIVPPWLYLAGAAVALAGAFAGGWQVRAWKAGADDTARAEAVVQDAIRRAEIIDRSAERFEQGEAAAAVRERIVIQEVERVVEKPVYREQCLDDDGLRILAGDIAASNARRGLAPALPAASSPR